MLRISRVLGDCASVAHLSSLPGESSPWTLGGLSACGGGAHGAPRRSLPGPAGRMTKPSQRSSQDAGRAAGASREAAPQAGGGGLQNVGGGAGGTQDGDLPVPGSWNVDVGTGAHAAPERQEESDIETFLEAG